MRNVFFQTLIDAIRGKIPYLYVFKQKADSLLKNINNVKTLVLGSSHLDCGYKAEIEKGEFNLATRSQDLYYSFNLYKFCVEKNPKIENVVLSFSVFSRGHCLIKTKDAPMSILYKKCFNIDYQLKNEAKKHNFFILEKLYNLKKAKKLKAVPIENLEIDPKAAQLRAEKHLKNNKREITQMLYLEEIFKEAKKRNQKIFVVIPPATSFYKGALPSSFELFSDLFNLAENYGNVKILNLYDNSLFEDADFFDADHLNSKGALKLTNFVREEISCFKI